MITQVAVGWLPEVALTIKKIRCGYPEPVEVKSTVTCLWETSEEAALDAAAYGLRPESHSA